MQFMPQVFVQVLPAAWTAFLTLLPKLILFLLILKDELKPLFSEVDLNHPRAVEESHVCKSFLPGVPAFPHMSIL